LAFRKCSNSFLCTSTYIFSFFPSVHGGRGGGGRIFWFSSETEKSGTLLQTDGNEAEIVDSDPSYYKTSFDSAEKELKLGHWCVTMLELRKNITESKILLSYEFNINTWYKAFISDSELLKKPSKLMVICSVKVKALQLFNACHDDKHYRRQNSPHNYKSGDELDMISFFNSAVSINLKNRENLLTKPEK
jgi:hypothetical protein